MNFPQDFTRKGPRRKGPRRKAGIYMLALEYLLWPNKRPHGLQKALAYANGITPNALNKVVCSIRGAR